MDADATLALGICGAGYRAASAALGEPEPVVDSLTIEGYEVQCGFFRARTHAFEPEGAHRESVLVETRAFSCNYRDKALILRMANLPLDRSFYPIGSELCGTVAAVGTAVTDLSVGDRVLVDGYWASGPKPWGLPTNHASRTRQILPARKLMRIPDAMGDAEAAAFSIGAQTSFGMVRRTGVAEGSRVLVTGGSSNTSLFLLRAARLAGGEVSATTTSAAKAETLRSLGAANVFVVEPGDGPFARDAAFAGVVEDTGGFDVVLDPFADLYLRRVVSVMALGGRYASCGFERQFPPAGTPLAEPVDQPVLGTEAFHVVMTRNLQVLGNCLGTTDDLAGALAVWEAGDLPVTLDSVFERPAGSPPASAGAFLARTYLEPDRLGKVVYRYA